MAKLNLEQKGAIILAASQLVYSFSPSIKTRRVEAIKQEEKRQGKQFGEKGFVLKSTPHTDKVVDHPFVVWLIENLQVVIPAYIGFRIQSLSRNRDSALQRFFFTLLGGQVTNNLQILIQWVCATYVYKHIPYFSSKRINGTLWDTIYDYFTCNFPVSALFNIIIAGQKDIPTGMNVFKHPLFFIFRLTLIRIFVDLGFWIGHYLLHLKQFYFIHKKHHEHNNPEIRTNYHFSAMDQYIEAVAPLIFAFAVVKTAFKWDVEGFEGALAAAYIFSLEIGSHTGKPVPIMSTVPPIGVFFRKWDDWNVWFHEVHHNRLRCNYSITPFWDWLFGTIRWP